VTTNKPSVVSSANIRASTPEPGIEAEFTLTITPEHNLLAGGGLQVVYPPQVTSTGTVSVKVSSSKSTYTIDESLINLLYEPTARSLVVTNVF